MNSFLKLTLVFFGGLLVAGGVFGLLVNPRLSHLAELKSEMTEKQKELITLEQQILAYVNAQTDLSRAARKDEILSAFVEREELVEAVINLETAAATTGTEHALKINEDKPDAKPNEKTPDVVASKQGLDEVPYRITTYNDFEGTLQFLQYLEHLPEFTEISKINLSAETVESEISETRIYTGRVFGSIDGVFFIKPKQ
jgi:hypothetical protein